MKAYCENPKCGDEFDVAEFSDGDFCSYDCVTEYNNDEDNLAAYESARYSGASPLN